MTSSGSSSETSAFAQLAGDPLAAWKSVAENALRALKETRAEARKKGASGPTNEESAAEIGRLAKSLQRLHPAASESISATVSAPDASSLSFDRTLRSLADTSSTAR